MTDAPKARNTLPGCMAPDGADPCAHYRDVVAALAAAEAERDALKAENERLREALKPFAHDALCGDYAEFDDDFRFGRVNKFGRAELRVGDFRRARAALTGETDGAR